MLSYFAVLREVTHTSAEEWTRPAATLRDLLHDLVARYGPRFGRWVLPDGEHTGLAIVLVNGSDVRGLQGLDTPLKPNSEICIFPPVAGG